MRRAFVSKRREKGGEASLSTGMQPETRKSPYIPVSDQNQVFQRPLYGSKRSEDTTKDHGTLSWARAWFGGVA